MGLKDEIPTPPAPQTCPSPDLPDSIRRRRRRRREPPSLLVLAAAATVVACLASVRTGPPAAYSHALGFELGLPGRSSVRSSTPFRGRECVILNKKGYITTGGAAGSAPPPRPGEVTSSYVAPVLSDGGRDSSHETAASAASRRSADPPAPSSTLLDVLRPRPDRDADQIGPTQLAYVGDIVYEVFVRCRYLWPARRTADLQSTVIGVVRAEAQSHLLSAMIDSFPLTEKEQSILTRGRNAGTGTRGKKKGPKRLDNGGAAIYQDSTALEALLGYVYMEDAERCFEILDWVRRTELDRLDAEAGLMSGRQATAAAASSSLLDLLQPNPARDVNQIAPVQLAYLGDSIYELMVRNRYVWPHRRTSDLHNKVVSVSRAEMQSRLCNALKGEGDESESGSMRTLRLTEREESILTRGRNAGASGPRGRQQHSMKRRLCAEEGGGGGGGVAVFQDAAALEALLGYTYINDAGRCLEMLDWIRSELDILDSESSRY